MYWRPSSSVTRAPRPSRMKGGVPPTARKARTGEFTPPGMSLAERSKSSSLRLAMGAPLRRGEGLRQGARRRGHVAGFEERGDHGRHGRTGARDFADVGFGDAADRRDGKAARAPRT